MSEGFNEIDKVISVDINDEMKKCYIDYAMSVIVARALPDVRDGLKPVQRRILYAMNEMNLDPNKGYRKSARIVGDTMGKYHPHGDSSIYSAMVRMAQNFSMRYMLVDGHGNFGSIDGYGAAASRYTEARMSKIAVEMLADIEKNTVDFEPNYDGNEKEPVVLPSRIPNILLNGTTGIAVGMATNIPPHNLGEVMDGIVCMIDNKKAGKETDVEELMEYIKGPDFPTGATILGKSGIRAMYRTGRGKLIVRSLTEIEPMHGGRERIVVTEIPYMVNKLRLIEKIAELVKDKKIEGISDLYDASSGDDIKIIIELKKDVNANVILNQLYKFTSLQESYGAIMIALVDGKPKTLNLKEILEEYLKHQEEVVTRRTKFDLDKAEKRAHILEGLRIAIDNIDEVIQIIRTSYDNAKERLMERFGLSDVQAQAILDMQLKRLQGLEHEKIDEEYRQLMALIKSLKEILADENKLFDVIKSEIIEIKNKFNDERRTQIIQNPGEIDIEDLIEEEASVIAMTSLNYIKRTPLATYKSQNRGGRGIIGMQTREEDAVTRLFVCSTHDYLLFFTSFGRVYKIKGYEVPEAGRTARGLAIVNLLNISQGEKITAVVPVREFNDDRYLVMITKSGVIKKTSMESFSNIRKAGLTAVNLREGDELISAFVTDGKDDIIVATRNGMGICFNEEEVRPMGRTATGVRAILLSDDDYVVSADIVREGDKLLNVTEKGYGKRTDEANFSVQHRGGKGVKIHQITDKTGKLSGVIKVGDNEELMIVTSEGVIIRLRGKEISTFGRISQGVKLINLGAGITVAGVAKISEDDIMEQEEAETENVIGEFSIPEENTDETEE
ncbi:DNA gyrase subunit A [Anaerotignum sp. MSJ-24]|uniref:DNA gyrase subunit A n=1 Tax=Anaerotignum sp. MSJ-24 TaxID=2841521 RepID=UPI001C127F77|nr:DNA gyrase subunit A [Anaerotignum sp. MSJ-24]MBU5463910.1 DNA gyrase subunit A [Anaerotignum sp. MSJ-24]